jgi:hypothetical protein
MKLNRLEAHDRYQHFTSQSFDIGVCCQNLIDQRPFGTHPFYIFAHTRTDDDGVTKRLIWQPRLSRPRAQTNSMLFKAYPPSDIVKVIWMIPDRLLWKQYQKGNLTENKTIMDSIHDFQNNRAKLEEPEPDDLADEAIDAIYMEISNAARKKKLMEGLYLNGMG